MGLTMGLSGPVFLGIWRVMMAAMMFPSAAPMILTFSRVSEGNRARGRSFVPTWCWLLFAILFPLGIMNIAAMAVVALLVFLEKTAFTGPLFSQLLRASLCAFGLLVLAAPNVLPQTA
jgi:predicted metal-binding membrane protein